MEVSRLSRQDSRKRVFSSVKYRVLPHVEWSNGVVNGRIVRTTFNLKRIREGRGFEENRLSGRCMAAQDVPQNKPLSPTSNSEEESQKCFDDLSAHYGRERVENAYQAILQGYSTTISGTRLVDVVRMTVANLSKLFVLIDGSREEIKIAFEYLNQLFEDGVVYNNEQAERMVNVYPDDEIKDIKQRIMAAVVAQPNLIWNKSIGEVPSKKEIEFAVSELVTQHLSRINDIKLALSQCQRKYELSIYDNASFGRFDDHVGLYCNLSRAKTVLGRVIVKLYRQCNAGAFNDIKDISKYKSALEECMERLRDDFDAGNCEVEGMDIRAVKETLVSISKTKRECKNKFKTIEERYNEFLVTIFFMNLPLRYVTENKNDLTTRVEEAKIEEQMYQFAAKYLSYYGDKERNRWRNLNNNLRAVERELEKQCVERLGGDFPTREKQVYKKMFFSLASNPELLRILVAPEKQIRQMVSGVIDGYILRLVLKEMDIAPLAAKAAKRDIRGEGDTCLRRFNEPILNYERRRMGPLLNNAQSSQFADDVLVVGGDESRTIRNIEKEKEREVSAVPRHDQIVRFCQQYFEMLKESLSLCCQISEQIEKRSLDKEKLVELLIVLAGERSLEGFHGRSGSHLKNLQELRDYGLVLIEKRDELANQCELAILKGSVFMLDAVLSDLTVYKRKLKRHVSRSPQKVLGSRVIKY